MEIFKNIATVVGCVSACMALSIAIFKPLRKWIIDSFTRQSQSQEILAQLGAMSAQMKEMKENTDKVVEQNDRLEERLTRVEKNVLENEADRIRAELFDFGNRCRRGIRLHPEEFEHIKDIYHKYSVVLKQNHEGETEYNFIHDYYNHQQFSKYHEQNK